MTIHSNFIITPYISPKTNQPKNGWAKNCRLAARRNTQLSRTGREPWKFCYKASQSITLRHQLWEEHARAARSPWGSYGTSNEDKWRPRGVQKMQKWYDFSRQIMIYIITLFYTNILGTHFFRFVSFKCGLNTKDWWTLTHLNTFEHLMATAYDVMMIHHLRRSPAALFCSVCVFSWGLHCCMPHQSLK